MVLINPNEQLLGTTNAVLTACGLRYEYRFAGPLSAKSVMRGSASWETRAGRYEVVPGSVLLLNDGEEYEITIDAREPVETFCLFFESGFVEDAWRASMTSSADLLDRPHLQRVAFSERLHFDGPLVSTMQRMHASRADGEMLEAGCFTVALELVRTNCDLNARIARLPALRTSTRDELARRLAVATEYFHANLDRDVTVADAAREACLSLFHFHRLFAAFHGTTPHQYLSRLRLERARALLSASGQTVAEVAVACGFTSTTSFTTLFKRTFGITPAAFRRNEEVQRAESR